MGESPDTTTTQAIGTELRQEEIRTGKEHYLRRNSRPTLNLHHSAVACKELFGKAESARVEAMMPLMNVARPVIHPTESLNKKGAAHCLSSLAQKLEYPKPRLPT
eukprot:3858352-Amphidinium_carterae.1